MATNVPPVQFTPTGLVVPQESEVLAGVQSDINDAFGGNVNPALETPQGQLASSMAAIVADSNAVLAEFINQVNPDTASGFMQDAIARIYFLNRQPGAPTVVQCEIVGNAGTVIPLGAQASDTSGNLYTCVQAGAIPPGGSITLTFANIVDGPIPCPANTLTVIHRAIPGWDTINNPAPGVPGANVESQTAFAYRRAQSVAINARGSLQSIYAAVFNVDDVIDVYATENQTNAVQNVGQTSYPLAPHSLYVATVGGTNDAVAKAIWTKKDVGCDYNGNTEVTVTDDSGYLPPLPTYVVKFQRPAALPILFAVEIQDDPNLPANVVDLVKAAIIAAFVGADGGQRVRIGSLLLASKFYAPVIQTAPGIISVLSILLGSVTPTLNSQLIGVDQAPTVAASDITVTLVP
jgi:hypothetical protein